MENDQLTFTRNETDMIQFSQTAKQGFVKPEVWNVGIPFENAKLPHANLVQNFVNAILDGEPLIAPGAEGIHSVELANVMVYSSLLGETVALPMDGGAGKEVESTDRRVETGEEADAGRGDGYCEFVPALTPARGCTSSMANHNYDE